MAKANPFRFSTKCQDDETDLLYYGYRYYNASSGRWLSKDPIREPGQELLHGNLIKRRARFIYDAERTGSNLYEFAANDGVGGYDGLGLRAAHPGEPGYPEFPRPLDPCQQAVADAIANMGGVSNDRRAHCIHSCEIAKKCGKRYCRCLGNIKEARDLFFGGVEWVCSWVLPQNAEDWLHGKIQGGSVTDSALDFEANEWGLGVAADGQDCVKGCEARYGPEPAE